MPITKTVFTIILAACLAAGVAAQGVAPQTTASFENDPGAEFISVYAAVGPRVQLSEHLPVVQQMTKQDRRDYAVNLLKSVAFESQAPLIAFLQEQEAAGRARIRRTIWLNNVVSFDATPDVVDAAAAIDNVLYVRLDRVPAVEDVVDAEYDVNVAPLAASATTASAATVTTNVQRINADDVWAMGYRGQGVTVAIIDTRFNYNHPDLVGRQWSNPGESIDGVDEDNNGYVDDVIGWDFGSNDPFPFSTSDNTLGDGHGTRVAGIVCGDGSQGTCTGVAPEATAMFCSLTGAPESSWWAAYQYAVAEGADVIASSNSLKWPGTPDYSGFRQATDMELLSGLIHANSIGNQGNLLATYPIPFNVSAPGNCPAPWTGPDQTVNGGLSAVMGCGALASATSNNISASSGRGPAAWTKNDADNVFGGNYPNAFTPYNDYFWNNGTNLALLKPDVCAPSNGGTTSTSNGYQNGSSGVFYGGFGGTSAATPHLGGMMCLLLSIDPLMQPEEMARIIQESAVDLGAGGKDNVFGHGRIDCLAAANLMFEERGGLQYDDVVMMTSSSSLVTSLTHMRSGENFVNVFPTVVGGTPFPSVWGNGAIEHIDNTPYMIIAEGQNGSSPYSVFLLDFSTSCTRPDAYPLGSVNSGVNDVEYDRFSGNVYLALANGDIRAINGPIGTSSFISAGAYASGTPMSGIAVSNLGSVLIGATATGVFRICPQGSPQLIFPLMTTGCNGIDVDHITGDIYCNSFAGDVVARYDQNGNFIENVLEFPYIDGADDVEFHQRRKSAFAVGRHGGGASFCIFGSCGFFDIGDQTGNDNVVVAGVRDNGGQVMATAPNIFAHGNTGTTANIAVVSSTLYDTAFNHQIAGTAPRGQWENPTGGAIINPSVCGSSDAGYPKVGSRWLEVSAAGSNNASPPSGSNPPVGANEVRTYFAFDANAPRLEMDLAFVNAEGVGSAFADFGGAYMRLGQQTSFLVLRDVNSPTNGTSTCYSDPVSDVSVSTDLRAHFPTIQVGEVVELVIYCGNHTDGSVSSRVYVDDVRSSTTGIRLDVTTPANNTFDVNVSGAQPNANLLTMLTLTPNCPRGAGPAAGLHGSAFEVISFFAPPIWAVADGSGSYAWSVPGIPPGLMFEFVTVQFNGPFHSVSNIAGPIVF